MPGSAVSRNDWHTSNNGPSAGELLPALSTGFTDSVYLRAACGTVAYGFSPMLATPADVALAGFHAKDERVHVDDLLLAVQFHEHAARALLG